MGINFCSAMEEKYIYRDTNKLVIDKSYSEELLDYCFTNFFQAEREYDINYDSNILVYNIQLKTETITVKFDVESIYHILGLPNYKVLVEAEIIKQILLKKYNLTELNDENINVLIRKIKNRNHLKMLSGILKYNDSLVKQFDCDLNNINKSKLNWDKISYKLCCFLNIGDLTTGNTSYYEKEVRQGQKRELLFKRDLLNSVNGEEYSLTIQFIENVEVEPRSGFKKIFYNPKSIRLEKIPKKSIFVRETNEDKNLSKNQLAVGEKFKYIGDVIINKQNLSRIRGKLKWNIN